MTITDAQALFDGDPGWLNTASYGLPPRPAWDALQVALADWRRGNAPWEVWGEATDRARASFARIIGADVSDVAVGSVVSPMIGLVAASLEPGARVLAADVEFASNLFPYLVQESRGVEVDLVPLFELPDRIDDRVDVVAVSAVQSATGEVADLSDLSGRVRAAGALLAVDATQAVGWLPIDARHVDVLACGAYKWLCSPRGTGFMYVAEHVRDRLTPHAAGWYAGDDIHSAYYGPPLRLADDARRFDISPAWQAWVGTAPALEVLERVGIKQIHEHNVRLANRFRAGLGLPPSNSAIVAADVPDADQRLDAVGIKAATRAGSLRVSFHLYSTEAEVDAAVEALVA